MSVETGQVQSEDFGRDLGDGAGAQRQIVHGTFAHDVSFEKVQARVGPAWLLNEMDAGTLPGYMRAAH